jgi:Uma2 family endonuclease
MRNTFTPTPVRVTLEEYLSLPETTLPHELVEGELRRTAAPSTWHLVFALARKNQKYDRTEKSARYPAAGVTEYWLADSENETIEIRRLDQRPPLPIAVFTPSDSLTGPLFPGFALPVAPIFAR